MSERVFAVPREVVAAGVAPKTAVHSVRGAFVPHGFWPVSAAEFRRLERHGEFFEREPVEIDPALKQLIPYAVVVRGDEVFLFRRTKGGGEKRLHGLRSIGVGGHVNPVDASTAGAIKTQHGTRLGAQLGAHANTVNTLPATLLYRALRRELHEELVLPGIATARLVGLLNDDQTAVGAVHLGVVAVVEPAPGSVLVREHDTMTGGFVGADDLRALHRAERDSFESWSALLIDRLDEVLACPIAPPLTPAVGWSTPTPKKMPTSTT